MRVIFICSEDESLGVGYLSSYLKRHGHETFLAFDPRQFDRHFAQNQFLARVFNREKEIKEKVIKLKPDLVAFSVLTANYQWALRLAGKIKEGLNVPIIFGGIHPTLVPEVVIKNEVVDMLCLGEGEEALLELVESLERGGIDYSIKNIWFKREGKIIRNEMRSLIQDLDRLSFPDKDLFYEQLPSLYRKNSSIITSRGCPFDCTFCASSRLRRLYQGKGKYLRQRSVANVIEELIHMKRSYGARHVFFRDDVFTINTSWIREFIPEYIEKVNLPFTCLSHPQLLTQENVSLLKKGGCKLILLGVQSGSESIRKRAFHRRETNENIMRAAEYCRKEGLRFSIDHIFNIPYETEETIQETFELYNRIRPQMIHCYGLLYFPGIEIIDISIKAGILKEASREIINEGKAALYSSVVVTSRGSNLEKDYRKYALLLTSFPLLPRQLVRFIIHNKRLIILFSRLPLFFIPLIKTILNFRSGMGVIPLAIIKNELYFTRKLIKSKFLRLFSYQKTKI